jgi:hypothetical protein
VLLTSATGDIQVNVDNRLDVPVKLRVRFEARTLGLETTPSRLVEVPALTTVPVQIRAQAQRTGEFFVDAQLEDRNGGAFGEPTVINLRSTGYGRVALSLTLGAALVLLVAAAVRVARRALRSRV